MGKRWRDFVEGILPWYSPTAERLRNARTEAISRRSVAAQERAERVLDDYIQADDAAHLQHRNLINEVRDEIKREETKP